MAKLLAERLAEKLAPRNLLTATQCKSYPAGRYADGGGLYLYVSGKGARSWVYRYSHIGKRKEMGLGSFPALTLAAARAARNQWEQVLASGKDPMKERDHVVVGGNVTGDTLADMTAAFFKIHKRTLRDEGKAGRWLSPLHTLVLPKLGAMKVTDITQHDIEATLGPVWQAKPNASKKALTRLRLVLTHAAAKGHAVDLNAALLAKALLGDHGHTPKNIPAMAWRDAPAFYQSLTSLTATALALRLLMLTAARSRPIRYAHVDHFDLDAAIWTIPGEGEGARQKGRLGRVADFRVPLSSEALKVVRLAAEQSQDGLLFPGKSRGVISDMSMTKLMRDKNLVARPHGFRSTFRDWAADSGNIEENVAETVLSHAVGSAVARAYRRTDLIEERRKAVDKWSYYLISAENRL